MTNRLYIYILLVLIFARCAQITPLTGGKRDSSPPKVLQATPNNASVNFASRNISIEFDEYIGLRDMSNQFIITPKTQETPVIQTKGKTLKINFNENLLPNTTYKLSFGNAIVDLHENNSLANFEYVFSTGSSIDSLKVNGQVIDATTKKPVANALVGLYSAQANDSVVYKEKPLYQTRSNNDGSYNFSYLPNNIFKAVAISDGNKNGMYDGSDELIAFSDSLVKTSDSVKRELLLFKELPHKTFIKKTIAGEYGKVIIVYNKSVEDFKFVKSNDSLSTYYINSLKDTVIIYYQNVFDTLKTVINRQIKNDTLIINIPSKLEYEKLKKNNQLQYKITSNISSRQPYYLTPRVHLNFPFDFQKIKKEKLVVYKIKDSLKTALDFEIEESKNTHNAFKLNVKLENEANYIIMVNKGAIVDYNGRSNDSMSFKFTTTSPDDYAQLNLKLLFPKKENYIVLLLNDKEQIVDKQLVSFSLASTNEKNLKYEHVTPGNYFIRVVEDANKNNVFDTGSYFKHIQPEIIYINSAPIKLLAGWEIENEWIVK